MFNYDNKELFPAVCLDFVRVDKIVVCNLTHGNEIAKDLIGQGIANDDLILLDALIYWL